MLSRHQDAVYSLSTSSGVIDYRLTRSAKRKKTVQLFVRASGEVEVLAPVHFSPRVIEQFIHRKAGWIVARIKAFEERASQRQQDLSQGTGFLYLGRTYPFVLRVSKDSWGRIHFDEAGWTIDIPEETGKISSAEYARQFLEKWYKSRAKTVLDERVAIYAERLGEIPKEMHIRSPKRLWGSCHPVKRILHFNWKIIMAPIEVVDYVVVHELSHLKVADHSRRFWAVVEKFYPGYKNYKGWLKLNAHRFELFLE
ncbi:MAG: M48 family metallopeptidase [Candidatus Omnitrophica bacterium]|nr:M48 family metallopeptidase [Candidatus Omnitrophota bacterium]